MVTSVTSATTATTAQSSTTPPASASVISSDFETFLLMLTTQMQNQDPLNPIDSSDYAVQLATFSSVEQQVRTNDLLTSLGAQMGVMGMAQLAGWVGMEARATVPAYFDGDPITVSTDPALTADEAYLVVRDASGNEVERRSLSLSAESYDWTGLKADGTSYAHANYTFEVESYGYGDLISTKQAEVYGKIVEAKGQNGATVLVLEGGAQVNASAVTALRDPDA
ncbi:Basal-body rod modification protein FlgD [Aquimixticola soesokkakensis]|uniref:Basal-body rod modification protein FlgD n=1 Tax=Aquimixticola soesokkakensis TaxID=1519096 RepID=A0A1Y5RG26_9RHOB|nr:flagellar hook capping FlgD N-terminal domain-containing protein [Aquimixticola soesokkakensis]SLN13848.1 Basal-body rod modification protein FlgD [Aquimixticola soesokkakensis]